jgi:uncharacterized protein (TIGR03435 family)
MFKKVARATVFTLAALVGAASQSAPKFDVVSIKPGNQNARNPRFVVMSHGRYNVEDQPVLGLILFAFDLDGTRLVNAPAWIKSERYTIDATASGGEGQQQMRPMVQALLADRFHLMAHREQRRLADYELLVAPGGSKFPPAPAPGQPWPKVGPIDPKNPDQFVEPTGNEHSAGILGMANLSGFLASELGRPVIDKSGINGSYEIRLLWKPGLEEATSGQPAGPSLFTAVREQLGLQLKAAHDPIDVLVIDRIARPTAN